MPRAPLLGKKKGALVSTVKIGELVGHIVAWQDFATRVLAGEEARDPDEEENWPCAKKFTEADWKARLDDLRRSQRDLREAIEALEEKRLEEIVSARSYPHYQMLWGVIHHNLYHAGQIALFKRAWNEHGRRGANGAA